MNRALNGLLVAAAGVAMVGVVAGCRAERTSAGDAVQRIFTRPTKATVERRDVTGYEFLAGQIVVPPEAGAAVYAPQRAPVERVNVAVGQEVRYGEVIIHLAYADAEAYLDQAQATMRAAQAAYEQARVQYEAPVREAREAVAEARATERTVREQTSPGGDATALQEAQEIRLAAQQTLRQAEAEFNTAMVPYRQQLDSARTALEEAQAGHKIATVEAPISGTVLELRAQPGQEVGGDPRTPVARIVNLAALQVRATVDANQEELVQERKPVFIRFAEFPERVFEGRVASTRTVPAERAERVVREATIEFDNTGGAVKPNMKVQSVGVRIGQANDALAVPVGAVDRDDAGKAFVKVMSGEQWVRTEVELGFSDGEFVVVKKGLEEGQAVEVMPGRNETGPNPAK